MRRRGKDGEKESPEPIGEDFELQEILTSNLCSSAVVSIVAYSQSSVKILNMDCSAIDERGRGLGEGRNFSGGIILYPCAGPRGWLHAESVDSITDGSKGRKQAHLSRITSNLQSMYQNRLSGHRGAAVNNSDHSCSQSSAISLFPSFLAS